MDNYEAKIQIAALLDQADELVKQARDIAFEYCTPSVDHVSDIDLQDVRDAIASVRGNIYA